MIIELHTIEWVGRNTPVIVTGVTMWIRRKCAPGALYSPWTRNCGKLDTAYNYTDPWLHMIDDDGMDDTNGMDDTKGMDDDDHDNGMTDMNGKLAVSK